MHGWPRIGGRRIYDAGYQVTGVTYPNNDSQGFTYDGMGNRLTQTFNSVQTTYTYDAANEMTAAGTPAYTYDSDGGEVYHGTSLSVTDPNNTFITEDDQQRDVRTGLCFDQNNDGHMTTADTILVNNQYGHSRSAGNLDPRADVAPLSAPDGKVTIADTIAVNNQYNMWCTTTSEFAYNGDGLRVSSWAIPSGGSSAVRTDDVWDIGANPPVVLEEIAGSTTTDFVYGLDLIESVQGSSSSYYLTDGLGSTTGLTNGSGTVTDSYTYDVFGAPRTTSGTSTQPFRYTGEQRDSTTGLYYLRARMYDPATGRFLTQDPVPQIQAYAYVDDNPATFTDPSGNCKVEVRGKTTTFLGMTLGRPQIRPRWPPWRSDFWDEAYHLYIVTYDPIDGSEKAYRGQSSFGGSSGSGGSVGLPSLYGGHLEAIQHLWNPQFVDWDPDSKHVKVVKKEDGTSCDSIRTQMSSRAQEISRAGIPYNFLTQNSNSAVRSLLEAAGIKEQKPGGWAPGWENELDYWGY